MSSRPCHAAEAHLAGRDYMLDVKYTRACTIGVVTFRVAAFLRVRATFRASGGIMASYREYGSADRSLSAPVDTDVRI